MLHYYNVHHIKSISQRAKRPLVLLLNYEHLKAGINLCLSLNHPVMEIELDVKRG